LCGYSAKVIAAKQRRSNTDFATVSATILDKT
jgi:hypothetical protein